MEKITIFLPLIGVVIGGVVTGFVSYFVQKGAFERQRKWEKEKLEDQFHREQAKLSQQFEHEMEKLDKQFIREQIIKKLEVYNKILKVHGDVTVVERNMHNNDMEFKFRVYIEKVKPLLFESFHLLTPEVAEHVNEIEELLSKWDFMEDDDEGEQEHACRCYEKIISTIELELDDFRSSFTAN